MKNVKKTDKPAAKTVKTPVAVETKPASLKAAPVTKAPVATAPVTATVSKPAKSATTTIEARIDVGFGNNLFVRGQGAGLSWNQGAPLVCVDGQVWRWTVPTADKLTFKLLLNDAVWSQGEDLVVEAGKQLSITPRF